MVGRFRFLKYFLLGLLGWIFASTLAFYPASDWAFKLGNWSVSSEFWNDRVALVARAQAEPATDRSTGSELARPSGADGQGSGRSDSGLRPFSEVTADLQKQEGLFTVYRDRELEKLYLAIAPEQLNRNFLLVATLESGLGEAGLFRGRPVNDLVIQFREAPGNQLQVVVPNTYIRNPSGQDWQQRLLDSSFSDSTVLVVDTLSVDPDSQAKLIDLSNLIVESDVANLSRHLSWATQGYRQNSELSRVSGINLFSQNLEVGTTVGFSSGGRSPSLAGLFGAPLQGLPDERGFTLGLRYSFSALPENNGYQPRIADERVGYFVSAFRTPPQAGRADPIVRYINRWHLEKADPSAALSSPKKPIVFWLENTVPPAYREALRNGVLLWNEAFEQAGFKDAVVVEQMPSNADWDPADIRYNTIRWSDSLYSSFAGIGPSRVNPLTGEILDADVVIDANAVQMAQQQYQSLRVEGDREAENYLQFCGQPSQPWYLQWLALKQGGGNSASGFSGSFQETNFQEAAIREAIQQSEDACSGYAARQHTAFGTLALSVLPNLSSSQLETYIQQYLTMLSAHEVGHVLGLRHNFAGSNLLPPAQLNSPELTSTRGFVSSVMDYLPPNIAPPGAKQGAFFPNRLGAYDLWAIQYGYQSIPASPLPEGERQNLSPITALSDRPELGYAPDEDIADFIDPEVNAWDLSSNPLQFAQWQLDNAQAVWQRLNRFSVSRGESYGSLRQRVDLVFGYFRANSLTLTNYVGGQRFRRLNPWESSSLGDSRSSASQTPLEPISAAKQREALDILNQSVFAPGIFQFSAQLLNQLPSDRWQSNGLISAQLDYPIYDRVLAVQSNALSELMYSQRLARIRDMEFKSESEDNLTIAELFESLYQGVWSEVASLEEVAPEVSSLRRGLQRHHLNILSNLVLRRSAQSMGSIQSFVDYMALMTTLGAPEDARVLARYQLRQIYQDVGRALSRYGGQIDVATLAHWEDVRDRIDQTLEAPLIGL